MDGRTIAAGTLRVTETNWGPRGSRQFDVIRAAASAIVK